MPRQIQRMLKLTSLDIVTRISVCILHTLELNLIMRSKLPLIINMAETADLSGEILPPQFQILEFWTVEDVLFHLKIKGI